MYVSYAISRFLFNSDGNPSVYVSCWDNDPGFVMILRGSESLRYFPEYGNWECE